MAGYHQFHAVNKAVACTLKAASPKGDRRVGVVWHTQGSGKSLTMAFYAGKIIQHPAMANPSLVLLTDRNDLDDQLFGTFSACQDLLRQVPEQAESRDDLKVRLQRSSGGVIFTTIQKFLPEEKGDRYPLLSERQNIVVIADEAHRSQYGFIEGFARHMRDALPNASFIGITATPIESDDRSTPTVFGEYIDIYDIQRAIEDGATVRIVYEGRLAKLELKDEERPKIDPEFEEVTEGEEPTVQEKLKTKWARMEAMVGTDHRIRQLHAYLKGQMAATPGAVLHSAPGEEFTGGILAVDFPGVERPKLQQWLYHQHRIRIRGTSPTRLRLSTHVYHSFADLDRFLAAVAEYLHAPAS